MKKVYVRAFLLSAAFLFGSSSLPAYATAKQEKDSAKKEQKTESAETATSQFSDIESLGILEKPEQGSLGFGLYQGSDRHALTGLVRHLPSYSTWIGMQSLANRFLMTAADATKIDNNMKVSNGQDLLTLRIERLMARGLYEQAFALYSRVGDNPYDPLLMQYGIISMLLVKEKGAACLEMETAFSRNKDIPFWKALNAYCNLTISETSDPAAKDAIAASEYKVLQSVIGAADYTFEYTPQAFEALSMFERGVLVADNRISIASLDQNNIRTIPSTHIQALLAKPELDNTVHILLLARAIETGVTDAKELQSLLKAIAKGFEMNGGSPKGIEQLALLNKNSDVIFEDAVRAKNVSGLFDYAQQFSSALLIPFLPEIEKLDPATNLDPAKVRTAIEAFLIAERTIPTSWASQIAKMPVAGAPADTEGKSTPAGASIDKERLLLAALLLTASDSGKEDTQNLLVSTLDSAKNPKIRELRNIIENIDNLGNSYARVRYVYENGFDSARNSNYTMPPAAYLSELENARERKATGEAIMLGHLVLQGTKGNTIYSGLLIEVLESLNSVGLTKSSREILAQAVLEME